MTYILLSHANGQKSEELSNAITELTNITSITLHFSKYFWDNN